MTILTSKEIENAHILSYVSRYTYCTDDLRELEEKFGIDSIEKFSFESSEKWQGMSGIICYFRNYIIVAFKGSSSAQDWLKNFRLLAKKYKIKNEQHKLSKSDDFRGKVHTGFIETINSNWENLWSKIIEDYRRNNCKLLLAGHSLGGALATLFSLKISSRINNDNLIEAVYTYGAPMVGDQEFYHFLDSINLFTHYRFEYGNDPIPGTPPLPGYIPTGQLYYLPAHKLGEITTNRPRTGVLRMVNFLGKHLESDFWKFMGSTANEVEKLLENHNIASYIAHIETYYKRKYPKDFVDFKSSLRGNAFFETNEIFPWN